MNPARNGLRSGSSPLRSLAPALAWSWLLLAALVGGAAPARASSYSVTLQPGAATTRDTHLDEKQPTVNHGSDNTLVLRATDGNRREQALIAIPHALGSGLTILSATLGLQQSAASDATAIDARLHPVAESWSVAEASWLKRAAGQNWAVAGGTFDPRWTDRALVSSATTGSTVTWEVGPALAAAQNGALTMDGLGLTVTDDAPEREVRFASADASDALSRPSLVVRYTDEPPAVRAGVAEVQPRRVSAGASGVPVTLWLDVDASGATPSGAATGFDVVHVATGTALAVTAVDHVEVGGVALAPGAYSLASGLGSAAIRLPRVQAVTRVRIDLRVDVGVTVAIAGATGIAPSTTVPSADLRVAVDDTATPGCWAQPLWPGEADGTAGNGDDWVLTVSDEPPVSLFTLPDSLVLRPGECGAYALYGIDANGDTLALSADSVRMVPAPLADISSPGLVCALQTGNGTLTVLHGALSTTMSVTVAAPGLPAVTGVVARDARGVAVSALTPADTLFVDAHVAEGDGFKDVASMTLDLAYAGHGDDADAPAYHARFQWSRAPVSTWTRLAPASGSWELLPALCVADTTNNAKTPYPVRFALRVGPIARASASGEWTARVSAYSTTPPATAADSLASLDCRARLVLTAADTAGSFNWGRPGDTALPLGSPADGSLGFAVEANTDWVVEAGVTDLAGTSNASETLFTRAPTRRVQWALGPDAPEGRLDSALVALASLSGVAPVSEGPVSRPLGLWVDLPGGLSSQAYRGALRARVRAPALGSVGAVTSLPLTATVATSGFAAQSAIAEIVPDSVVAGTAGQALSAYLMPTIALLDGGIDRVIVTLPPGYQSPVVKGVTVGGLAYGFTDQSVSDRVDVRLALKVLLSSRIRVSFTATTPSVADPSASDLVVAYDDASSAAPPQTAVPGNADGVANSDDWHVHVLPGPLARVALTPEALVTFVGDTTAFTALATDAFGNAVDAALVWSATGGVGTAGADGRFAATTPGAGSVIVTGGAFADTAAVTVWPGRGLAVRAVRAPATLHQTQTDAAVSVRVENLGATALVLDQMALSFGRLVPGDADADYAWSPASPLPLTLAPGRDTTVAMRVDVDADAYLGAVRVDARASAVEVGTGARFTDGDADTTAVATVTTGGLDLDAAQDPRAVPPGATDTHVLTLRIGNRYPDARTLTALTLANTSVGPAGADTLDAGLGEVTLHVDDGDGVFEPAQDPAVLRTVAIAGALHLAPLAVALPAAATVTLFASADLPLEVRDGDLLDLALAAASDLTTQPVSACRGTFPLAPTGGLRVDGMVAAQVRAVADGPSALKPGVADQPALHVVLPPNGYRPDVLERITARTLGTAQPVTDLTRVCAWVDDGDGAFDAALDRRLGTLAWTGDRWELGGLAETVPVTGLRVFLTVDVSATAREGLTVRLALPGGAYPGVGMRSGNSGPLDTAVPAPQVQTISDVDRITLTAVPHKPSSVNPGARGVVLLHLTASNSHDSDRTLTALTLTDRTSGSGTQAERDREVQVLWVRDGGDGSATPTDADPALASGSFEQGRAVLTGLSWTVPARATRHLWVTADVSATAAADGDVIGCAIDSALDVGFAEPTTLVAAWPLDSDARRTVDGFVAAQAAATPVPPATLAPGDGPALALDLRVPGDGYRADVLEGVRVTNLGTAGAGDVAALRLWADGGDGVFGAGAGDDLDLGTLSAVSGGWQSPLLARAVPPAGQRVFVSLDVAAGAAESTTVRLAVPVDGIRMASGDDGPLDAAIAPSGALLLSRAPLLGRYEVAAGSTIGQTVTLRLVVRNVGDETVRDIAPSAPLPAGTGVLTLTGGPTPATFDLAPAAVDTFTWTYDANAVGDVAWHGDAGGTGDPSGLARRAPAVTSGNHRVYRGATRLDLEPVQTMPAAVRRGQADVVPFSLTLTNPGGAAASDVLVRRLRLRVADESGSPAVPAAVLARVLVNEGTNVYLDRATLETAGDQIDLTLSSPVRVTGTEPTTLSLRLTVSDTTRVTGFRVEVPDSTWIEAADATSGAPATAHLAEGAYPVRSGTARVVEDATALDVAPLAAADARVARGATAVTLLRARFENPGLPGITADVRVTRLGVVVRDSAGAVLAQPGTRLAALRLMRDGQTMGTLALGASTPSAIDLPLALPLAVASGAPADVTIEGDVAADAPLGTLRLALRDSSTVEARDAVSHAAVPARYAVADLTGGLVRVEGAADSLRLAHRPLMPDTLTLGALGAPALELALRHPGGAGVAHVRLDSVRVGCRDALGRPLAPAVFLTRARLTAGGTERASALATAGADHLTLAPVALTVAPGETLRVTITLDVTPAAPAGAFEVVVGGLDVIARDVNTGVPVTVAPEPSVEFPLRSGLAMVRSPSRELAVRFVDRMPVALADGGEPLPAATLTLRDADALGSGGIRLEWLRVMAAGEDGAPLAAGAVAERIEAWVGGARWAVSPPLGADSTVALLLGGAPLAVPDGGSVEMELRWVPRAGAASRVRLGWDRACFGVEQPAGALLAVQVHADSGQSFPMWTASGGFVAGGLAASLSNFPNPFAAGREATTFAYHLPAAARVTVRILTPGGESVVTVADGVERAAGVHEEDRWDGRNGRGDTVRNGVYVAEVVARFTDGRSERVLRKVAVVR